MAVGSIVDYLKGQGKDSSYNNRKKLAEQYGISSYSGTAGQNTSLLKALQGGGMGNQTPPTNPANANAPIITPVSSSGPGSPATNYLTGYKPQKYSPSDKVNDYADRLNNLENNKPGDYSGKYDSQINDIINNILNRPDFDANSVYDTDLYKNYREQYMQQGNKAMRDTIGNISGMTGGYGSTYATAAGQQAYDNQISQMGDKTLGIYDRLYQQYLNEGQEMYNQLGTVNNQDSIDYNRYRDTVNDYYNDRNYYAGRYDSSYAQDFGEYQYDQGMQQWAEQYAYQKVQDAYKKQQDTLAQQNWQTQFDYQKQQDAQQYALQQQQLAARNRGGSGSKGGGSKTKGNTKDLSTYVSEAKKMLDSKDGHGRNNYGDGVVLEHIADTYPDLSEKEIKQIMEQAGGDYNNGIRILKNSISK